MFSKTQGIFTWHLASGSTGLVPPGAVKPLGTPAMPTAVGSSQPVFPHHSAMTVEGGRNNMRSAWAWAWGGWPELGCKWESHPHKQVSLDPVSSPCMECCPPTPPDIHRRHFSPRSGLCLNVTSPGRSSDRSPTHSPVLTPFACLHRLVCSLC